MSKRRVIEFVTMLAALTLVIWAVACSGSNDNSSRRDPDFGGTGESSLREPRDDGRRCPTNEAFIEESLDTSGDNVADVRKVYRVEGEGEKRHKVIVCRELDLNHDGRKDLFRFYSEEGRPLRELTDGDFDGRIDQISYFENGRIVKQEADRNHDGQADETRNFVHGKLLRVDRDDNYDGDVDVWEHWANGRLLRIGYDVNHDKVADFWHRAPPRPDEESDEAGARGSADDESDEGDAG